MKQLSLENSVIGVIDEVAIAIGLENSGILPLGDLRTQS